MAIVQTGTQASFSNTASTTVTLTAPSGIAVGEFLLAHFGMGNVASASGVTTPPSGWTQIAQSVNGTAEDYYYKFAAAGDTSASTYSWTVGSANTVAGSITRFTGVDPTNPIDAAAVKATGTIASTTGTITLPAYTAVTPGSLLICGATLDDQSAADVLSIAGFTTIEAVNTAAHASVLASKPLTAAGSVGTVTVSATASYSGAAYCAGLFALRPLATTPAFTMVASQTFAISPNASTTITVPAMVTLGHLGVLVAGTDNPASTTLSATGWTSRVANPTGFTNSSVNVQTSLGVYAGGNTFTLTESGSGNTFGTIVWYDTGGNDVSVVGTPATRNGTSQTTTSIPSLTTSVASPVILIGTTRVTTTQTAPSVSPAGAVTDVFSWDATTTVGQWIGHVIQGSAGATSTYTETWQTASANGVGVQLAVTPASTTRIQTAAGGTQGTTVSAANSAGGADTAWDLVSIPAGNTLTYDVGRTGLAYNVGTGTDSSQGSILRWGDTLGLTAATLRCYVLLPAGTPSVQLSLMRLYSATGTTAATLCLTSAGKLVVQDSTSANIYTSTNAVPTGTWVRLELGVAPGTTSTTGKVLAGYATADAAIAETYNNAAMNTGTVAAVVRAQIGKLTGTWSSVNILFDDVALSPTLGFVGPPVTATVGGSSPALSGSGTLAPTTATPAVAVTPTLSGSGGLGASPVVGFAASPALSGSGTTTVVGGPGSTPSLAGSGTLTPGTGTPRPAVSPALSGSGTTTVPTRALSVSGSAALTGAGSAAIAPSVGFTASFTGSGVGVINGSGFVGSSITGLSGLGQTTVPFTPGFLRAAALVGTGALGGFVGFKGTLGTATLTGGGGLTASGSRPASFSGVGTATTGTPQATGLGAFPAFLGSGFLSYAAGFHVANVLQNSFEGGTAGATVTAANSGGASGDAFATVIAPASPGTITYSTAASFKGRIGLDIKTDASISGIGGCVRYDAFSSALLAVRVYFQFTGYPPSGGYPQLINLTDSSGFLGGLAMDDSGTLIFQDNSSSTIWSSTNGLNANTWYRLEFVVDPTTSTTTGKARVGYALGDGALVEDSGTMSGLNWGTSGAITRIDVGKLGGTYVASKHLYWDDLSLNLAAPTVASFIGPSTTVAAGSGTFTGSGRLAVTPRTAQSDPTAPESLGGEGTLGVVSGVGNSLFGTGSGTLTAAPQLITGPGATPALTGIGTTAVSGKPSWSTGTAFTALGTLGATRVGYGLSGAPSLTGAGTMLAATTVLGVARPAALSASGTMLATGALGIASSRSLSGVGTLAGSGYVSGSSTISSLSATGVLTIGSRSIVVVPPLYLAPQTSGAGTLAFSTGIYRLTAAVALTGSGALSPIGTLRPAGTATLTGTGTVTLARLAAQLGTAGFSGSGALLGAGVSTPRGTPALTGTGVLVGTGQFGVTAIAPGYVLSFAGSGALTGSATNRSTSGLAALSGSGSTTLSNLFSSGGRPGTVATVALAGSGALAGSFVSLQHGVAPFTGLGALGGVGISTPFGTPGLTGAGALVVVSILAGERGAAALTGVGVLLAGGGQNQAGPAAFGALGALLVQALARTAGSASLTGGSSLVTSGPVVTRLVVVALAGVGTTAVTVTPRPVVGLYYSFSGAGTMVAGGSYGFRPSPAPTGAGALSTAGTVALLAAAALAGLGSVSVAVLAGARQTAAAAGTGAVTVSSARPNATPAPIFTGTGTASVSQLLGVGARIAPTGIGTLTTLGAAKWSALANTAGAGALTALRTNFSGSPSYSGSGRLAQTFVKTAMWTSAYKLDAQRRADNFTVRRKTRPRA